MVAGSGAALTRVGAALSFYKFSCYNPNMTVRMRHTRSHTKNRRSHHALAKPALSKDESGNVHLRHRMSNLTGAYRGRKVIDLSAQLQKRAKKVKETAR